MTLLALAFLAGHDAVQREIVALEQEADAHLAEIEQLRAALKRHANGHVAGSATCELCALDGGHHTPFMTTKGDAGEAQMMTAMISGFTFSGLQKIEDVLVKPIEWLECDPPHTLSSYVAFTRCEGRWPFTLSETPEEATEKLSLAGVKHRVECFTDIH